MQNMISSDFLKFEWWCHQESLEWTLKEQKQMDLFLWQTCSIIKDQSRLPGLILMQKVDLSLKHFMTFSEMKKYLIHMERSVILDFSSTMDSLLEIMMQMKFLWKFSIICLILRWILRKSWLKMLQNIRNLEWAKTYEKTQCKNSSHGLDLLNSMKIEWFWLIVKLEQQIVSKISKLKTMMKEESTITEDSKVKIFLL